MAALSQEAPLLHVPKYQRLSPMALISPERGQGKVSRLCRVSLLRAREVILVAEKPWQEGDPAVRVVLRTTSPQGPGFSLTARIVVQLPLPDGTWLIGCEFTPALSPAVLRRLK